MTTKIPKPPGLPLLGNISDVDPSNTWVSLQKLWEKYGEIFKITVLGQDIVFVANTALCEELCDEKRFRKFVGGPIVEIRKAVHASLFTAFDDEAIWGVHHRILAPSMTPTAASEHFTQVRDVAAELTAKWRERDGTSTFPAIEGLNRLDLETTTLCFFGRRLHGLTGVEPPMIRAMDQATGEAMKRPTRPKLVNWLLHQSRFEKDCKTMRQYAADCLQYRKDNPTDRKDLLYTMLNAKDPETGQGMNETQIIDEIVTMPIGSSTAPCVISSAIYYLLQNPECIGKAREEIDSIIGGNDFTHEHLDQLPYCAGIVRESLRLSAAAPGFNIEPLPGSKGPVLLGGGKYQVPATQMMIIVLHGVNRDPAVFEEPEAFKPDRMVGEAFERLPEGAKKWFGNGKRICYGKNYAWMWLVTTLVTLLKDVDFEMADPGYKLKQDGWFNLRPVGFNVKVQPRASLSSLQPSSINLTIPIDPNQHRDFRAIITYDYSDRPKGFELATSLGQQLYVYWRNTANQRIEAPISARGPPFFNFLHRVQPIFAPGAVLTPVQVGLAYCFLLQGAIEKTPASWPGHVSVRMQDLSVEPTRLDIGVITVDNLPAPPVGDVAANAANANTDANAKAIMTPTLATNITQLSAASIDTEKRWLTCWSKVLFYFTRHSPSARFTDDPHLLPSRKTVAYYFPCGVGKDELVVQIFPSASRRLVWDSLGRAMVEWVTKAATVPLGYVFAEEVVQGGVVMGLLSIKLGRQGVVGEGEEATTA
ncbi:MAG: hypothetical protein Q9169_004406 [Polycauliona sp. 2 TL-2023]